MELLKNLEGLTPDEQMTAVVELQKAAMQHLEEQKQASIGKSAELVIQGLKKIKSDFEERFNSLNYDIQTKVASLKDGEQGLQGPKGDQGERGLDGSNGRDGRDGKDGKDGVDGVDGVGVRDAKIDFDGSLVISLTDGREINCGEVVSVDVAKQIQKVTHNIQTGAGGDSQTVLDAIAALQATIATYGTMATQNANNVAITGGNINNTVIGGTTPATGVFTTLTAQNETLKGTGNNFFTTTTTFSNFGLGNGTITLSTATTDPFGGTSVYKLVANAGQDPNASSSAILSGAGQTLPLGVLFTQSIYFKAAELSALRIRNNSSGEIYTFTIGVTPTATAGVQTPALTSIGNGWYRASWTFVTGQIGSVGRADNWSFRLASTGDGVSGIYVSSPQLEYGSTLSTYLPNATTSALYNNVTLSFLGVASIGLQSDGSLYVQPAGTGALQAQATTSSAVGGNARGANAVDWSTKRDAGAYVASGSFSVLSGGASNAATGTLSFVGGGQYNTGGGSFATGVGGFNNTTGGAYSFTGSGNTNVTSGQYASIVGGLLNGTNTSTGYLSFVGGGSNNTTNLNTAVTTQSATMNGTTAVTLAASNANIKVGQLITGTSIVIGSNTTPFTYVAAISGTSLTLSQAASGSSTSTLSFYTPHGVVVGGGNNQATGAYSFIGGGGDAGTAANRNVASGDWSGVLGGTKNTASGNHSSVSGGYGAVASGVASFVGGGGLYGDFSVGAFAPNTASGVASSVVGGFNNTSSSNGTAVIGSVESVANGLYSAVFGGSYGTTRGLLGNIVFPANNNPLNTRGGSQAALIVLGVQTTDATATVLRSNTSAAGNTNQVILPNNSAYYFRGEVVSGVTGGGNTKGWFIEGVIKRGANAASTALVGTPTVTSNYADAGASTWTIAVTADTTNGGLAITFTGQASTTIRTVAQIRTTEMTY